MRAAPLRRKSHKGHKQSKTIIDLLLPCALRHCVAAPLAAGPLAAVEPEPQPGRRDQEPGRAPEPELEPEPGLEPQPPPEPEQPPEQTYCRQRRGARGGGRGLRRGARPEVR